MYRSGIIVALSLATAATANADIVKRDFGNGRMDILRSVPPASAPEVDPSGILNGVVMLGGALAVIRGRRKR
jgi:hypothetical protein